MEFLYNIVLEYAQTFIPEIRSPWTGEAMSTVCHAGILEHFEIAMENDNHMDIPLEWRCGYRPLFAYFFTVNKYHINTLGILLNDLIRISP